MKINASITCTKLELEALKRILNKIDGKYPDTIIAVYKFDYTLSNFLYMVNVRDVVTMSLEFNFEEGYIVDVTDILVSIYEIAADMKKHVDRFAALCEKDKHKESCFYRSVNEQVVVNKTIVTNENGDVTEVDKMQ